MGSVCLGYHWLILITRPNTLFSLVQVCVLDLPMSQLSSLKSCGHTFCVQCWDAHCETQISTGVTTNLSCMMSR